MAAKGDSRSILKTTLAVPLFIIAALFALWPLGTSSEPRDHADTLFNTWLVSWNNHAILHLENPLKQPAFAGFEDGQGRNDLLLTQSMVALPLHLSGMKPILIHNILMVFFLALAGYAAALLAVQCGAKTAGAVFTGTAVALLPWFQSHIWHLQLFSGGLGLMALFFAMRTSQGKSKGWQTAFFILLQCLASLYMWFFMNMALLLFLPFTEKKGFLKTAAWTAAGNLICLPFLLRHFSNAASWPVDTITSTDAAAFPAPWGNSLFMGWMRYSGVH
ncbi:hypothetical protein CSA37_12835 [Candidatus Fermentibacteria bacterium]|nr:MAG: hypothetical protein CSA37_12835 [Candidatus Fermentibacteria bacterium]